MYTHRWKLTLEVETDQGIDGKESTKIEVTGTSGDEGGTRAVNECIAISMAGVCEMLIASGRVVGPSTIKESAEAFAGK